MIVDRKDASQVTFDVPVEMDAPPAYDDIHTSTVMQRNASHHTSTIRPSISIQRSRRIGSAAVQPSCQKKPIRPTPSPANVPPRSLSAKTQADVRETVRGLIRDVVHGSSPIRSSASAARGVLDSCAAACASHSLSLARILQERSIEYHSPLYWAIISRPSPPDTRAGNTKSADCEDDAFLLALVASATPLAPAGMSDLRCACLVSADNAFFQRLRSVPGVVSLSGTDRMLIAGSGSHANAERVRSSAEKHVDSGCMFGDTAYVREGTVGVTDSFRVSLQVKLFQRRMRVSGEISIEFIARGRLWLLVFFTVPPLPPASNSSSPLTKFTSSIPAAALAAARVRSLVPGSWAVALALLEGSTQCYAEALLHVEEPETERDLPPLPERSRTVPDRNRLTDSTHPPSHARQTSAGSDRRVPVLSFFTRSRSEDKNTPQRKPPITMILTSYSGSSPLLALPLIPNPPHLTFPGEVDLLLDSKSKNYQRKTKQEKRAAKMAAAKERRACEGRETRKEKKAKARLAEAVVLAAFEEVPSSGKKEDAKRGGELMYDGCPYIAPDGTLRAVLEARLSTSPPPIDSDCVIC